ncbi:arylsulfatase B-like [Saccoglossus kowalevskii]
MVLPMLTYAIQVYRHGCTIHCGVTLSTDRVFYEISVGSTLFESKQPHIVLILAEDLGWNDVGWHNPDLKMPILNQLAADGVIFNQSYVQPACTPSRSALFTGYYPFKIKRQHQMLFTLEADGLSLDLKILPEMLKDVGYLTHLIGKWHLGYCKEEYLPNKRGFDSFYGWLAGGTTLYTKENTLGK